MTSDSERQDCIACKTIGFSAFAGAGSYAFYVQYDQNRKYLPRNASLPMRALHSVKRGPVWLTVVGVTFYSLAIARVLN
jgi:hypothetical protein